MPFFEKRADQFVRRIFQRPNAPVTPEVAGARKEAGEWLADLKKKRQEIKKRGGF